MRETNFIKQNKEKWSEFESELNKDHKDADKLNSLFIQLTDDLSYARTYYKHRSVRLFLNNITQQIYYHIIRREKLRIQNFTDFWKRELPYMMYEARKELSFALLLFIISLFIGFISDNNDKEFGQMILGNGYINMTNENIAKNDPMAVYKSMHQTEMFLGITINNLKVALISFICGILFSAGSMIILMYNGIMVGVFQNFFIKKGLFKVSFLTIWMHGSLEIPAIIISSAAGIILGKCILLPGTYTRLQSLQLGGKRAFKIFAGITPIIVLAAIIESFVTRYTDLPDPVRLLFILGSASFIVMYFIWHPYRVYHSGYKPDFSENKIPYSTPRDIHIHEIKSASDLIIDSFQTYRENFSKILRIIAGIAVVFTLTLLITNADAYNNGMYNLFRILTENTNYQENPALIIPNTIILSVLIFIANSFVIKKIISKRNDGISGYHANYFIGIIVCSFLINLCLFAEKGFCAFLLIAIVPFLLPVPALIYKKRTDPVSAIITSFSYCFSSIISFAGSTLMIYFLFVVFYFLFNSPINYFLLEFIEWNIDEGTAYSSLIVNSIYLIYSMFVVFALLPLIFFSNFYFVLSTDEIKTAHYLKEQISKLRKTAQE